jgi:hypothetical protein
MRRSLACFFAYPAVLWVVAGAAGVSPPLASYLLMAFAGIVLGAIIPRPALTP